ncbi:MAG: wax ester/triacylglycerol synthase family O-acyltransferase [Microthrixaceae bacterium]
MKEELEGHIGAVDAFTLNLEARPAAAGHDRGGRVFDRVPDWDVLLDRMERASRLTPRFREKLVEVPLAPPRWIVDPEFDISMHLRRGRIPSGGGMEAVVEFARVAGMTAFDHDRALWEFTLLEGLPDGRAALVMKFHHALTDGIGGIEIAAHVVDFEREPPDQGPLPPAPEPSEHGLTETVGDVVGYHLGRVTDTTGTLLSALPGTAARLATRPLETISRGANTVRGVARFARPVTRTLSPVMSQRRPRRDCGTLDVPLGGLHDAAHGVGGTLNDAFLAAVAGGLRLYHERHGADVESLRVCMPMSIRTAGDDPGGNKVTLERFELPVGTADPRVRMTEIGRICRELRNDPAIPYAAAVAGALNLLPVDVTAGMIKHVDVLARQRPGFPDEVYIGGALLSRSTSSAPRSDPQPNVTPMSYRDTCHVGVITDSGAVVDPEVFRECLAEGFSEVVDA